MLGESNLHDLLIAGNPEDESSHEKAHNRVKEKLKHLGWRYSRIFRLNFFEDVFCVAFQKNLFSCCSTWSVILKIRGVGG